MGRTITSPCLGLFVFGLQPLLADPTLRLVVPLTLRQANGDVQPVWITPGTDGPGDLSIEAVNEGDGALAPTVNGGPSPWLLPEVTGMAPCTFDAGRTCTVIAVRFAAAGLAPGTYEGQVEVRDPAALDAPQRVRVRIYVGTNVPDRADLFVPNVGGATDTAEFQTAGGPSPTITTTSAGSFLSVSSSGLGSLQAVHNHQVIGTHRPGVVVGANDGTFTVGGSSFGPDNRAVPVTLTVTEGPIADLGIDQLDFFSAEGVAEEHGGVVRTLVVSNRGAGDLVVDSVDVETDTGGDWLGIEDLGGNVYTARATVGALVPGMYTGQLRFNTNAANAPCTLLVIFIVQPAGPPESNFRDAVNGASFSAFQPLGPGAIGTIFGIHLASATAGATETPLPTNLAGVKVLINGIEAPLFFVSFGQVNFQVPYEITVGAATIRVMRDDAMGNPTSAAIDIRSPGIFLLNIGQYGIVTNFTQGNFPLPTAVGAAAGLPAAPARPGDAIVVWATGLGSVTPAVATGAVGPLDPLSVADSVPDVLVGFGIFGLPVRPFFAGLAPGFVGLFQINLFLPVPLATNDRTPITLEFSDGRRSNTVEIAIER